MRKRDLASNESLEEMIRKLRGKAVWTKVAKRDWPIYSDIYADQVVQIGGHTGNLAKRILDRQCEIRTMHVYEPDPKFCGYSKQLLHKYVEKV